MQIEPIQIPKDYDPNCTCGSLIPVCEPCESVATQCKERQRALAELEKAVVDAALNLYADAEYINRDVAVNTYWNAEKELYAATERLIEARKVLGWFENEA